MNPLVPARAWRASVGARTACLLAASVACAGPPSGPDAGDEVPDAGESVDAATPLRERESCLLFCTPLVGACHFGECLAECNHGIEDPDAPCDDAFYCGLEDFCVPRQVLSCAESPCIDDQVCFEGYCVLPTTEACVGDDPEGACRFTRVCNPAIGFCVEPPECGENGTCPAGTRGAVCNGQGDDVLDPEKSRNVCLIGRCRDDADCAPDHRCDRPDAGAPLGHCHPT